MECHLCQAWFHLVSFHLVGPHPKHHHMDSQLFRCTAKSHLGNDNKLKSAEEQSTRITQGKALNKQRRQWTPSSPECDKKHITRKIVTAFLKPLYLAPAVGEESHLNSLPVQLSPRHIPHLPHQDHSHLPRSPASTHPVWHPTSAHGGLPMFLTNRRL